MQDKSKNMKKRQSLRPKTKNKINENKKQNDEKQGRSKWMMENAHEKKESKENMIIEGK